MRSSFLSTHMVRRPPCSRSLKPLCASVGAVARSRHWLSMRRRACTTELLEEVRLLGNIETSDEKLLPLVLAAQPELDSRLEHPSLRQLKQRVALRSVLGPLELPETAAYIAHRIRTAGGVPSHLFTRESVSLIHECSGGIPRTISVICDNALVSGLALDRRPVDRVHCPRGMQRISIEAAGPLPSISGKEIRTDIGTRVPMTQRANPRMKRSAKPLPRKKCPGFAGLPRSVWGGPEWFNT